MALLSLFFQFQAKTIGIFQTICRKTILHMSARADFFYWSFPTKCTKSEAKIRGGTHV